MHRLYNSIINWSTFKKCLICFLYFYRCNKHHWIIKDWLRLLMIRSTLPQNTKMFEKKLLKSFVFRMNLSFLNAKKRALWESCDWLCFWMYSKGIFIHIVCWQGSIWCDAKDDVQRRKSFIKMELLENDWMHYHSDWG